MSITYDSPDRTYDGLWGWTYDGNLDRVTVTPSTATTGLATLTTATSAATLSTAASQASLTSTSSEADLSTSSAQAEVTDVDL